MGIADKAKDALGGEKGEQASDTGLDKASDMADDKTIHWRVYAARMAAALDQFRRDAANNAGLSRYTAKINSLADVSIGNVLSRMATTQTTQPADTSAVSGWRAANPVPALQPFTDIKGMVLKPRS